MASPHLRHPPSGIGIVTSVTSVITSVTILAANVNRLGATVYNRSNSRLYLRLATAPATVLNFTHRIEPYESFLVPANYQGIIVGIWAPNVSGFASVTEFTP